MPGDVAAEHPGILKPCLRFLTTGRNPEICHLREIILSEEYLPMHRFAAVLIALLGLTVVAEAGTISYADAVTQLAANCGADIKKLCKGLNLGNNRIGDCLKQNAAQVSPQCSSSLSFVLTSIQQRLQA